MQPSHLTSQARAATGGNSSGAWVAVALPLLVVTASFLGGATQRWSMALVLGGFSLLLLLRPPRHSLGPALNAIALLALALAAAAFLPARWFSVPPWRLALTKDFGIQLASTVTAQPWITCESMLLLLAGICWIYYVATLELSLRDLRLAARVYSAAIMALAALAQQGDDPRGQAGDDVADDENGHHRQNARSELDRLLIRFFETVDDSFSGAIQSEFCE